MAGCIHKMIPVPQENSIGNVSIQGWGLPSQILPFRYFFNFAALSKHTLAIVYHVYIWQVSPQLSCGDTCQIWMQFEESHMYFCHIENFPYGEINKWSFCNPHPRSSDLRKLYCNKHFTLGISFSESHVKHSNKNVNRRKCSAPKLIKFATTKQCYEAML